MLDIDSTGYEYSRRDWPSKDQFCQEYSYQMLLKSDNSFFNLQSLLIHGVENHVDSVAVRGRRTEGQTDRQMEGTGKTRNVAYYDDHLEV